MAEIGRINISGFTALAPLAGVTDRSFRILCREHGTSLAVTEMVSARGLVEGSERSSQYLDFEADEHPISVQIFGSEPQVMAEGACVVAERKPDLIDINCGCPVKKVVTRNAGAALLNEPKRLGEIISAMTDATDIPVTLKIRSGWHDTGPAVTVARVAEDAGAAAIAVHGRTRKAGFSGEADWDIIREVKANVSILVIGNGDVRGPDTARKMMRETECDMVMIGRWAIGNPWIFSRTEQYLATGELAPEPTFQEKIETAIRHLRLSVAVKGERNGVWEMRRHLGAYIKGMRHAASVRKQLMTEDDPEKVVAILRHFLASLACCARAEEDV